METMTITFGGDYSLIFDIEPNKLGSLWADKMHHRHQWPLDDPRRFYGFDDVETSRSIAEQRLKGCIDVINGYQRIIDRPWTNLDDQDYLNYLHNIFEKYHGLLDRQDTEWWLQAPITVRQALADLNILVHRAEATTRQNHLRLVCTWFGMPKDSMLSQDVMEKHGQMCYVFGGVYLNYVEIGKTAEDLSIDDDQWIGDDAFQPFLRYSADFNIRFVDATPDLDRMRRYFVSHKKFFQDRGIGSFDDYRILPRRYKVAQLRSSESHETIIQALARRQEITDIYLSCDKQN